MRLADLATDFWTLRSGEAAHEQHPDRFWIPSIEERRGLRRGDAAKLIFRHRGLNPDGSVAVEGERMWVIVSEVVGTLFVGILDNQPACLDPESNAYLMFGVEVPFAPEHVIDFASPPADYVEWQFADPRTHLASLEAASRSRCFNRRWGGQSAPAVRGRTFGDTCARRNDRAGES